MKILSQKENELKDISDEDKLIGRMVLASTPKESFFLLYARLLEIRCKPETLVYEKSGVVNITKGSGEKYVFNLENLWITCNEDRDTARQTIDRYLDVAEHLGEETPQTRESIIPWIKDQEYVDFYCKDSEVLHRHFAADLWIVFASQGQNSSRTVTHREIAELGIADDELLPLAIENLRRILPEIEVSDFGAWSLVTAGDNYVPSLLLFDDFWDPIVTTLNGDLIAVAPISDSVFFTSSESGAGLAHIRERALALEAEGDHLVSSTLLRRISGSWKAFD
jgi:uncharacterized protein YtpQ (UPF0354 family)